MIHINPDPDPPKVHMRRSAGGATYQRRGGGQSHPYADTVCRHNASVKRDTTVESEVTCLRCLKILEREREKAERVPEPTVLRDKAPLQTRWKIRSRLFRKPIIVLQVGEVVPYNYDPYFSGEPGGYALVWRDATPEDLNLRVIE